MASSVSSCLLWCLEQFIDCVFSALNGFNLVSVSTFLGRIQYTHLLHAQDMGFMEAGFDWRPMTELVYNSGHVILLLGSSSNKKHHEW